MRFCLFCPEKFLPRSFSLRRSSVPEFVLMVNGSCYFSLLQQAIGQKRMQPWMITAGLAVLSLPPPLLPLHWSLLLSDICFNGQQLKPPFVTMAWDRRRRRRRNCRSYARDWWIKGCYSVFQSPPLTCGQRESINDTSNFLPNQERFFEETSLCRFSFFFFFCGGCGEPKSLFHLFATMERTEGRMKEGSMDKTGGLLPLTNTPLLSSTLLSHSLTHTWLHSPATCTSGKLRSTGDDSAVAINQTLLC